MIDKIKAKELLKINQVNPFNVYVNKSDIIHFVRTVEFWKNSDGIDLDCLLVYIRIRGAQLSSNDLQFTYWFPRKIMFKKHS